jgi:hypothetical protein
MIRERSQFRRFYRILLRFQDLFEIDSRRNWRFQISALHRVTIPNQTNRQCLINIRGHANDQSLAESAFQSRLSSRGRLSVQTS